MDLISLDRALAQILNAPDADKPVIAGLISAASGVVGTYCNRSFQKATYDELHSVVGPTASIWVNNPPIVDVAAVRNSELPAVYVQCADPTNQVQLATVNVTATGVVLKRIYNGTAATTPFPFVEYPMFADLAAGINLLGNGWTATLSPQFALWRTDDLCTNQSGRNARNLSCPLLIHWGYLAGYKVDKANGQIIVSGGPYPGVQNYRVQYTGGYADVPEPVQQAVAELVQLAYASRSANPLMQSETLDKYSYTRLIPEKWTDLLSPLTRVGLNQFKVHRLTIEGVSAKA